MDVYQPERKQRGAARERNASRLRKQMVKQHDPRSAPRGTPAIAVERPPLLIDAERPIMSRAPTDPGAVNSEVLKGRALVITRDVFWYIRHNTIIWVSMIALVILAIGLFLGSHILGGRVFPNVWSLGVNLGDLTVEEASAALQSKWTSSTQIQLHDGDRVWQATPAQIGLCSMLAPPSRTRVTSAWRGCPSAIPCSPSSTWTR